MYQHSNHSSEKYQNTHAFEKPIGLDRDSLIKMTNKAIHGLCYILCKAIYGGVLIWQSVLYKLSIPESNCYQIAAHDLVQYYS